MHTRNLAFTLAARDATDVLADRDARLYRYLCARLARTRALNADEIRSILTAQSRAIAAMQGDIVAQSSRAAARQGAT